MASNILVEANLSKTITFAYYQAELCYKRLSPSPKQNSFSFLKTVCLTNADEGDLDNVTLKIESSVPYIRIADSVISSLEKGKVTEIDSFDITVDPQELYRLSEALQATLEFSVVAKDGSLLAEKSYPITLLPIGESASEGRIAEILASFVTPNDENLKPIIQASDDFIKRKYGPSSFYCGYDAHDPNDVLEQLDGLYSSMAALEISYSLPPASFEKTFQRVRLPYEVILGKLGTCLDFAIAFASLVEAVGLSPSIIIIDGHALVGVFLDDDSTYFPSKEENGTRILNLASPAENHLVLIDIVGAAKGSGINFARALESGVSAVRNAKPFLYALNVTNCRKDSILPLPTPVTIDGEKKVVFTIGSSSSDYSLPTINPENSRSLSPNDKGNKNRFDVWEEKLLDLNLRNALINLRKSSLDLQFIVPSADDYAAALAKNTSMSLSAALLPPGPLSGKSSFVFDFGASLYRNQALVSFSNKEILTVSPDGQNYIESDIRTLARRSNTVIEESGCNPLFLTIGLIKWYETDRSAERGVGAFYAPIFLLPVKLPRRKSGPYYSIEYDFGDLQLNMTALEYFKQNYGLSFSNLEGDLPKKDDVPDVRLIYNTLRKDLGDKRGWDIIENTSILAIFNFAHFVMWNDIKTRRQKLMENPIIATLVSGEKHFSEVEALVRPEELDDKIKPATLAVPLPADSSQIKAIADAGLGESFILDGPPGTGKSQTIANMIVNFLYNGKSVLFVAEKEVALDVVKERLDALSLGDFCLEISSVNAAKSLILPRLGKLLESGPTSSAPDYKEKSAEIAARREYLNSILKDLHDPAGFFLSPYEAIVEYLAVKNYKGRIECSEVYAASLDEKRYQAAVESLKDLGEKSQSVGGYFDNPFAPYSRDDYSFEIRDAIMAKLEPLLSIVEELRLDSYNDFVKEKALTEFMMSRKNTEVFSELLKCVQNESRLYYKLVAEPLFASSKISIMARLSEEEACLAATDSLLKSYSPSVLSLADDETFLAQKDVLPTSSFFTRLSLKGRMKKTFKEYSLIHKAPNEELFRKTIGDLSSLHEAKGRIAASSPYVRSVFFSLSLTNEAEIALAKKRFEASFAFGAELAKLDVSKDEQRVALCGYFEKLSQIDQGFFSSTFLKFQKDFAEFSKCSDDLRDDFQFDLSRYADGSSYWRKLGASLRNCLAKSGELVTYVSLLNAIKEAEKLVPSSLIDGYKNGSIQDRELIPVYQAALFYRILASCFAKKGLGSLSGEESERKIAEYKSLMDEFARLSVLETAARVTSSFPSGVTNFATSTEAAQLKKYAKNGGKGISLRSLFKMYGSLIHTLCPCFLMSPTAVVQYLDPDAYSFDAVIFDEASQIPTSEAIGAIARGKSVIIAGDQQQMPPTNFFSANVGAHDDYDNDISTLDDDLESLLDDAIVMGLPRKRLTWHYRSRHEALIAFSNNKFYENSLLTFPSPSEEKSSVTFHYVKEGNYQKGRGVNKNEALAIVKEVKRRLADKDLASRSIGIVTFNEAQQNEVENLLGDDLQTKWGSKKLFVKNLENVQGDEADVIYFSVTYGPDKNGVLSLNFGPLSRAKGERRLNVAVSRAREEMHVYSSILPSDIKAENAKNEGAGYLRDFLLFASLGPSSLHNIVGNKLAKSGVSVADYLAADLRKLNYAVDVAVGNSTFKIDLALKDPDDEGKYVLGILMDGESYCSSLTCRDRNIVEPNQLKSLKWNLIRVWSSEYLDHPNVVLNRIVNAFNRVKSGYGISQTTAPRADLSDVEFPKKKIDSTPNAIAYRLSDVKKIAYPANSLERPFVSETALFLNEVINAEYPISLSLLSDRLKQRLSLKKMGSTSRSLLSMALSMDNVQAENCAGMAFYWPGGVSIIAYRHYRLNNEEKGVKREISDISFTELGNAFADILLSQGRMSDEDLYKQTLLLFGFQALTAKSRNYLVAALKQNAGARLGIEIDDKGYVALA